MKYEDKAPVCRVTPLSSRLGGWSQVTLQNQRVDGTGTQQRVLRVPQLGRDVVLLIFIFIYLLFIWLSQVLVAAL